MMKAILPAAMAAMLMVSSATWAEAGWKRSGTVTGPNGRTATVEGTGSCANGSCSSTQVWKGPNGKQAVRQKTFACSAGKCSYGVTTTGPNGKTVKRFGSITRY
jgi:hypothetical protein